MFEIIIEEKNKLEGTQDTALNNSTVDVCCIRKWMVVHTLCDLEAMQVLSQDTRSFYLEYHEPTFSKALAKSKLTRAFRIENTMNEIKSA